MILTTEQMKALSPFEDNFRTAVQSNWARHPGSIALKKMVEIYDTATGTQRRVNGSCQNCVLTFLKDLGTMYFASKAPARKATKRTRK